MFSWPPKPRAATGAPEPRGSMTPVMAWSEIEVLACHAVDVRRRHPLDARQILIRRVQAVERDRVRPDRGEFRNRIALELVGGALLQLGRG